MKKRFLIAIGIVVAVILVALVAVRQRLEPDPPLPSPNGYDDFVKAGTMIEQNPPDWWSMTGEELHEALTPLVATNQAALELVRAGLTKECCVVPNSMTSTTNDHLNDLAGIKRTAQAFAAASRLALVEGRTNEAAMLALDCVRFGAESGRGGVLIDGLVSLAIRAIGLSYLQEAVGGMDIECARKTIAAFDDIAARSESYDEMMKRERQWARRGRFGPAGFFTQLYHSFLNRKSLVRGRQRFLKSDADFRLMQVRLAVHAYELELGKSPDSVRDLVSQYLKSVPVDLATGMEMQLD